MKRLIANGQQSLCRRQVCHALKRWFERYAIVRALPTVRVLIASALALTFCAVAVAAALPKAHTDYMYVKHGKLAFSVTLATSSAKH